MMLTGETEVIGEKLTDRGKPSYWEEDLSQCHLAYYKSHLF
jgi:hypothetical protein